MSNGNSIQPVVDLATNGSYPYMGGVFGDTSIYI